MYGAVAYHRSRPHDHGRCIWQSQAVKATADDLLDGAT